MTETDSKIGFWHYPLKLKFVVIWIGLVGLSHVLIFIEYLVIRSRINYYHLIYVLIYFFLVSGLVRRSNRARIWTSVLFGLSFLLDTVDLGGKIYSFGSFSFEPFFFHVPLSYIGEIVRLIIAIFIDGSIVYILFRPRTKAFFVSPVAPSPEFTQKETS